VSVYVNNVFDFKRNEIQVSEVNDIVLWLIGLKIVLYWKSYIYFNCCQYFVRRQCSNVL